MHCPYCNRKPNQIEEYKQQAQIYKISCEDYVRMDEGTYHPETDLFCCTSCYIKIGMPLKAHLHQSFRLYRQRVVPIKV